MRTECFLEYFLCMSVYASGLQITQIFELISINLLALLYIMASGWNFEHCLCGWGVRVCGQIGVSQLFFLLFFGTIIILGLLTFWFHKSKFWTTRSICVSWWKSQLPSKLYKFTSMLKSLRLKKLVLLNFIKFYRF